MKKEYMKPAMCVVELQHKTHLLIVSETSSISPTGLGSGDELEVSQEGGGSNIRDR
jgi:hypothetical protein